MRKKERLRTKICKVMGGLMLAAPSTVPYCTLNTIVAMRQDLLYSNAMVTRQSCKFLRLLRYGQVSDWLMTLTDEY